MKITILILLLIILAVIIAMSWSALHPELTTPPETPSSQDVSPPAPSGAPEASPAPDASTLFTTLIDGQAQSVTMAAYLPFVVAAEMPASFEAEALKAQAVAARTYILWSMAHEKNAHPEADVCSDPNCCKALLSAEELSERWGTSYESNWERVCGAVAETDGMYLAWEGAPILAMFHSSSAQKTEAAGNILSAVPYLVSVSSPETDGDVPKYITTVEVTAENLISTLRSAYPEAVFEGTADTWLSGLEYNDSGRVATAHIVGLDIPGTAMRTLFSLRSTSFTLEWTGVHFLFTVTGFGHGIGMSQYGANAMAGGGSTFEDILAHYYVGATLTAP